VHKCLLILLILLFGCANEAQNMRVKTALQVMQSIFCSIDVADLEEYEGQVHIGGLPDDSENHDSENHEVEP